MPVSSMSSVDLSLSGLSSGFDWKTLVNSLVAADSVPLNRLQTEETTNNQKLSVLTPLSNKLTAFQTSVQALGQASLYQGLTAVSTTSGSTWQPSATTSAVPGSYTFAVSQLAAVAKLQGGSNVGSVMIPDPGTPSTATIATLPIATAVTAGTFSVNGHAISFASTDSLQSVFDSISSATGGAVTAMYDNVQDKISLSSDSPIILGAANDTSNFLQVMKLANNGTGSISSATTLGVTNLYVPMATAPLKTAVSSGNNTFTVNGVSISYNAATDSISTVMGRINNSTAGVSASYDSLNDRVILTNNTTGDTNIGVGNDTGNLLSALNLASGSSTLVRGKNAQFTINNGPLLSSTSNTLSSTITGITGLNLTVTTPTTETIQLAPNTTAMNSAVQDFITKFNDIQSYLDALTQTTRDSSGKVTQTSLFSSDRDIQGYADNLRSMAFSSVLGLTGSVHSLDNLGIGFTGISNQLSVIDSTKLSNALANHPSDVSAFFSSSTTGFAAKMGTLLTNMTSTTGSLTAIQNNLTDGNKSIDEQIIATQARLADERQRLTDEFIAMESANSSIKTQSSALSAAFGGSTTTG